MSNTLDALLAARKLIENPEHWRQGPSSDTCFCAMGALGHVATGTDALWEAQQALYGALPERGGIANFNDNHSHAEVLALFNRAIEAERALATGGQ